MITPIKDFLDNNGFKPTGRTYSRIRNPIRYRYSNGLFNFDKFPEIGEFALYYNDTEIYRIEQPKREERLDKFQEHVVEMNILIRDYKFQQVFN